ncbi:MAG: TonB-dependent receptor [Verrucomicrobiota bacterium]
MLLIKVAFHPFPGPLIIGLLFALMLPGSVAGQGAVPDQPLRGVTVVELSGDRVIEVQRAGTRVWQRVAVGAVALPGDHVRIGLRSRALLAWPDHRRMHMGPGSDIALAPSSSAQGSPLGLTLLKGFFYFLQRARADGMLFRVNSVNAAIEGTEFELRLTDDGETILTLVEGKVRLSNEVSQTNLVGGDQGRVAPGRAPVRTAALPLLKDQIQWSFYYPAIINIDELDLPLASQRDLSDSLAAYRRGDLPVALRAYPPDRQPNSPAEQVYLAALWLTVGKVDEAERLLSTLPPTPTANDRPSRLARALRLVIAGVKAQPTLRAPPESQADALSSELLAQSYYWQATLPGSPLTNHLQMARQSARQATGGAPQFGYAWARLAELEFSFGHTAEALQSLREGLAFAPANAQALALRGFVLADEHKSEAAIRSFDEAIAADGALANAWLGRGLALVHEGRSEAGLEDLLTAATLEPQRAILRSYLGKLYADTGHSDRAHTELDLAKRFDPLDPTAWLYSALFNRMENRINDGVRDLQESQMLNDNRSLYRARFLLDQDRAVRSANLARIFRDVNMTDVSLREAARAVQADYLNYSSHLFLADSYDQLRDPNFVNLRLESAANSEYLIANLLAPVAGGIFNSAISQQEYSRLFEQNRLGVVSSTEFFSSGDWIERGAQYGIFDNTSYSLGAYYRTARGQRSNNDVEQRQVVLQLKQELSPKDTAYLEVSQLDIKAGDLRQSYDNAPTFPQLRTREAQEPILTLGYHRAWSPNQHTLLLASWLNDDYHFFNPGSSALLQIGGPISPIPLTTRFRSELEIFSIEPQHLWQQERNLAVVGGRFQSGQFRGENLQTVHADPSADYFDGPAASQDFSAAFQRWSVYGHDQLELAHNLWVTAGLTYDHLIFPQNLFAPPFSEHTTTRDQISPKAGVIWLAPSATTFRFAYSRSLTGASLEQSVAIEPTQIAGFNQLFRSLMPESITGSIPAASIDTYGVSLEQKVGSSTYFGLAAQIADSAADRTIGSFAVTAPPTVANQRGLPSPKAGPAGLTQTLDYGEKSVRVTADHLLGDEWALGLRYQLTYADLRSDYGFPETTPTFRFDREQRVQSLLHQVGTVITFNHPSGFFSKLEADWFSQSNHGYVPSHTGDDFWQLNFFAGYRFLQRRAEVAVGCLNLSDSDYRLDPLTFYSELRRGRTFTARFQFNF